MDKAIRQMLIRRSRDFAKKYNGLFESQDYGIVYHIDKSKNFGFIINGEGNEYYFNTKLVHSKLLRLYSVVRFTPVKQDDTRLRAENVTLIIENAYKHLEEKPTAQYRTFGYNGSGKIKRGYGGTLDNPWRAF